MIGDQDRFHLSGDERYELAATAQSAERRNKPAALVVLAGLVFVVACGALGVGAASNAAAKKDVRQERRDLKKIEDLAIQHEQLSQRLDAGTGQSDLCDQIPDLLSRIERLAEQAGLTQAAGEAELRLPREESERVQNVRRRTQLYTVRDQSLENLMAWVTSVVDTVPCTRVYRLDIEPAGTTEWRVDVGFERYEQSG